MRGGASDLLTEERVWRLELETGINEVLLRVSLGIIIHLLLHHQLVSPSNQQFASRSTLMDGLGFGWECFCEGRIIRSECHFCICARVHPRWVAFSLPLFFVFLPLVWIISNNRSAAMFLMSERNRAQHCPFTQSFYLREDGFHQTAQSCLPNRGVGQRGGKVMKTAFFMYSGRNAKWNEALNPFFEGGG